MIRAVLLRALPRLSPPSARHYSAAAIPAPNTQPEVHFNKVATSRVPPVAPARRGFGFDRMSWLWWNGSRRKRARGERNFGRAVLLRTCTGYTHARTHAVLGRMNV